MKASESYLQTIFFAFFAVTQSTLAAQLPIVCKLFTLIRKEHPNRNVMISPDTLRVALATLYFAAEGSTREELTTAFQYGNSMNATSVLDDLGAKASKERNFWRLKNRLYVAHLRISREYNLEMLHKYDFSAKHHDLTCIVPDINSWFARQTNGIFLDVIDSTISIPRNTQSIYVSVTYFKGMWEKPFDQDLSVQISNNNWIMQQTDDFMYGKVPELSADVVQLGFLNLNIKMMIFVPNNGNDFTDLESKLNQFDIDTIKNHLSSTQVNLKIPRFKINFGGPLDQQLKEIGFTKPFTGEGGEFGKLLTSDKPLLISKFIHKTAIDVNEWGVGDKAGVLNPNVAKRTVEGNGVTFNAEQGFYFSIYDETIYYATGLFLGVK